MNLTFPGVSDMKAYLRANALQFMVLTAVLLIGLLVMPHAHAHAGMAALANFGLAGQLIRCSDFNNVPTTGTAAYSTTELDEYSVYALHFELGGTALTRAMIGRVQIRVAGIDIINNITAAQLQLINQWKGDNSTDAAKLSFYFGNPDMVSERDQHYTDLDMSFYKAKDGSSPAKIEAQLDITGATAPTVRLLAEVRDRKAAYGYSADVGVPMTKRFYKTTLTPANSSTNQQNQDIVNGKSDGAAILHEHWFPTNLTDLEVKIGQKDVWQKLTVAEAQSYALGKGHPTQAGHMAISPTIEGFADTAWSSQGNFQHLMTWGAADTIPVFVETAVPALVLSTPQVQKLQGGGVRRAARAN